MAQSRTKTKPSKSKLRPTAKPAKPQPLGIELPAEVKRRLDILTEENDLSTVLSEALMLLWNHRYPLQPSRVQPTPGTGAQTRASVVPESVEQSTVVEAHPVETELPVVTQEETVPPAPMADREVVLERIQAMRDDGMSMTAIAAQLNREGVPTLSGSGKWHHSVIKRLLRE